MRIPIQRLPDRLFELLGITQRQGHLRPILSDVVVPVALVEPSQDRPNDVDRDYLSNAAPAEPPHGSTVRWEYTVPAGRRALLSMARARVMRVVAGGVVGRVFAEINVARSLTNGGFTIAHAQFLSNTVGTFDQDVFAGTIELEPGDNVTALSADFSTTTSENIIAIGAAIREFGSGASSG